MVLGVPVRYVSTQLKADLCPVLQGDQYRGAGNGTDVSLYL